MSSLIQFVPGSLVFTANLTGPGGWLGLVVDQEAGKKWVLRDPCLEFPQPEDVDKYAPILVRVIGAREIERVAHGKNHLSGEEPRKTDFERWAYIDTLPRAPQVMAGPDAHSVSRLVMHLMWSIKLGMLDTGDIIPDLRILSAYLNRSEKPPEETSEYARLFSAMLADVLPQ